MKGNRSLARDGKLSRRIGGTYLGVLFILIIVCPLLFGQVTASFLGTVHDPSGAVVPGARITVTEMSTGFMRSTMSQANGDYDIPLLPIGRYRISVEKTGFQTIIQSGITLQVGQMQRADFTLNLGSTAERVTVGSQVSKLQTSSASIGEVVSDAVMVSLPLNGRDFMDLTTLAPGVTNPPNDLRQSYQGVAPSANGGRSEYNSYLLDGVSDTDHFNGTVALIPPLDSIQEFRLQTSNYSAEYGQGGTMVVNIATKSGTNSFNGDLWEFLRNSAMDARNFFAPTTPPLKRNQFGGTLGGPIKKNKAFFSITYEGQRQVEGTTFNYIVPTSAERAGDFSQTTGPLPVEPGTKIPFPDNVIPATQISPISAKLLTDFEPLPNNPSEPLRNYIGSPPSPLDTNWYGGRFDERLSSKDSVFARYNGDTYKGTIPNGYLNCCNEIEASPTRQGAIGYTHIFSPTALNQFRFGANRYAPFDYSSEQGTNVASELGIENTFSGLGFEEFLRPFSVTGYNFPEGQGYSLQKDDAFDLADDFVYVKGSHTLKMGAEYIDYRNDDYDPVYVPVGYDFSGLVTGSGLADLLLGIPTTVDQTYAQPYLNERTMTLEPYVQDDWHVSPRLTLNLGLRYSFQTPVHQADHHDVGFNFQTGELIIPSTVNIGTFQFAGGIQRTSRVELGNDTNFAAPRFGLAYRLDSKTVIRAGYGVFDVLEQINGGRQSATNPPFRLNFGGVNNVTGFGYNVGRPSVAQVLLGDASGWGAQFVDPNLRNGYMQNWNLMIERQITPSAMFSLGYVGSKGTELSQEWNIDTAPPGPGPITPREPYPNFSYLYYITNGANSVYHSLQAEIESQYSSGLALQASYTYGKALGQASTLNQASYQNPKCVMTCEYGPQYFDVRNNFEASFRYELPFGNGKRFLNAPGVQRTILGSWAIAGIAQINDGYPLTVTTVDNANTGGTNRPNLVGNPNPANRTINGWIPRSAFVENAPYTYGNAGVGIVRAPGLTDFDLSLIRQFRVTEKSMFEFHADFFNAFNNVNFGDPDISLPDSTFGVISSAGPAREIQLGLKFIF